MPEVGKGTKRERTVDEYGEFDQYNNSIDGAANKIHRGNISSSDTLEVRLLLLGRNCGGIIGKGGENISRLRNTYNVTLRLPSTQTTDRAMTITGSIENSIAVVREVLTHCEQAPHSTNQQCNMELNLLVPTNQVGSIVGKGGSKITEIRNATQAKIKVYEECLPSSNERVIAIGGDNVEQLLATLTTVLNLLREVPKNYRTTYYMPENLGIMTAFPTASSSRKNSIKSEPGELGVKPSGVMMGAAPLMSSQMGAPQPLMGGNGAHPSSQTTTTTLNEFSWLQLQTTTTVHAPNEVCGAIIGKAGSRISQVRHASGAQITFSESSKEAVVEDRVITITGTQQQVQTAEQMITRMMSAM